MLQDDGALPREANLVSEHLLHVRLGEDLDEKIMKRTTSIEDILLEELKLFLHEELLDHEVAQILGLRDLPQYFDVVVRLSHGFCGGTRRYRYKSTG